MLIYKITNKKNQKIYVGQTSRSLDERMGEHLRHQISPIDQAIAELGIEAFEIEVIDYASSSEELDEKERYWISEYNCMLPNGYNQTYGGSTTEGFRHRDESKKRMSAKKSESYKGENNPFYGKTHSDTSKKKMSEARKGRVFSEEWKSRLSKAHFKKVINLDTGETFDSVQSAAEAYGLKATHISRVCKGKRKRTGGFRWTYYDA